MELIADTTVISNFALVRRLDLLRSSSLTEEDINELDHKMKREMMEKLGWGPI